MDADPALREARAHVGLPQCLHLGTFSYGSVEVSGQLRPPLHTVTLKDRDGPLLAGPVNEQVCRIAVAAGH